ncbi:hypothetical protein AYL99_03184 [Fonsecaea erecta]|uniref:Uncharacterized protein n=1 Tax=Fonsecaea erecta TaxID=1367422 RepID=A0A178ZW57_9EURO|nr:hypothetical protein AYL99_03184 [Fonsecaea erecta]OAP63957.1 hypothetical protein AYL99_03184 [Fonsecaea erecta]
MAFLQTFIALAMLLGILNQVIAEPADATPTPTPTPQLCTPLGHPDYDCKDPVICEKDWPSETGNYGLGNLTVKLRARYTPLRRIMFNETGVNVIVSKQPNYQRRRSVTTSQSQGSGKGLEPLPLKCCRPTVECFNFFADELKLEAIDYTGRLMVKDLNDWKKAECCMVRFQASCVFPPRRDQWVDWNEPPECADVH